MGSDPIDGRTRSAALEPFPEECDWQSASYAGGLFNRHVHANKDTKMVGTCGVAAGERSVV